MHAKWRVYIDILLLIGAGVLAMAGFITAKKPDAKKLLDKIAPYQGSIGVALLLLGVWDTIDMLTNLDLLALLRHIPSKYPKAWAAHLFAYVFYFLGIVEILLGFLLGFGLIASKAGNRNPEMAAKGEAMQKKLAAFQVPLGAAGAVIGILLFVAIISLPGM
jgi:hypothetical protein